MNANELADLLEDDYWDSRANKVMLEGAKMLRQQQAEIEALKQIIDANNLNQNIGQFVKPTNEPVAWMDDCSFFTEQPDDMDGVIPLYTHPVKELTEILSTIKCIADDVSPHKEYENTYSDGWLDACNTVYDEVFAILRKAQEK
jgi:hypothetical protein